MKLKKILTLSVVMALILCFSVVLTSCLREAGDISDDAGVGRYPDGDSDPSDSDVDLPPENGDDEPDSGSDSESEDEPDSEIDNPPAVSGALWSYSNGKYTYNFPPHNRNISDLSDMYSASRDLFEDQGNDLTGSWFPGKFVRNLTTGEVVCEWDRWPSTLKALEDYNGIYRGDLDEKVCYITFDCGYELGYTTLLLDTLKEKNVPAIFFLVSNYLRDEKELVDRMVNEGHLIGNHTMNHKNMTQVDVETFISEIEGFEKMYTQAYPNAPTLRYYRPPMGACNEWCLKMAQKMGIYTVMWSFAYGDYDPNNQPDPAYALELAKSRLYNGCVYLFHTESSTNAAILGDLIDWIRAQGYEILPICNIK